MEPSISVTVAAPRRWTCTPCRCAASRSKLPYATARQDGQPVAFAGLTESFRWTDETGQNTIAIMTTTRMPRRSYEEHLDRRPLW